MKTYNLTAVQIVDIYLAGKRRGEEEATAFEWGSSASGSRFDELENELIWGDGFLTGKEMEYDDKLEFWQEFKREAGIK